MLRKAFLHCKALRPGVRSSEEVLQLLQSLCIQYCFPYFPLPVGNIIAFIGNAVNFIGNHISVFPLYCDIFRLFPIKSSLVMIIVQMHLSDLIFPHKELPENEEHVVRDLRVHDHLSNLDPAVEISPDSRKKRPSQQPGSSVKVSLIIKNCVRKNLDYLSGAIRIPLALHAHCRAVALSSVRNLCGFVSKLPAAQLLHPAPLVGTRNL